MDLLLYGQDEGMKINKSFSKWASSHYINLAIYNALIVLLVLLHSAKYFDPYWLISINIIIFIALIASVFLLGANSRVMFLVCLVFWLAAGLMRILNVEVWAERLTIYVFNSFFLGVVLLFFEEKD